MGRAFGVAAGLDPEVARPLAARCAELGYELDVVQRPPRRQRPGDAGRVRRRGAASVDLGVAVIALDRTPPEEIAADIERLGLDPAGSGSASAPASPRSR